jgi:hypothetical protein
MNSAGAALFFISAVSVLMNDLRWEAGNARIASNVARIAGSSRAARIMVTKLALSPTDPA